MGGISTDRLEIEIAKSDAVIASWSPGLKASFDSLFHDTIETKNAEEEQFQSSIIKYLKEFIERERW